jgi:diguanylate cyclase (GGDEF)-like protein
MASRSVLNRMLLYVSLGLLAFAALVGAVAYRLSYASAIADAASLERQLVNTVRAQAEVAAFAGNSRIAEGVIEGLRASPRIRAVRLAGTGAGAINVAAGFDPGLEAASTEYVLRSPVDGKEPIGVLIVARNDAMIDAEASLSAIRHAGVLLLQTFATALLILTVFRIQIGQPLAALAADLARLKPGRGERLAVSPVHAQDEIGSLASGANALIDAAEVALAEVQLLATTDALTGLPNRRAFMRRLEDELARARRFDAAPAALLMIDLDHFKLINDEHGHGAGDAVLTEFGRLLASELRQIDSAGRIGGEEFGVLLPGTDLPSAAVFAERIRQRVAGAVVQHQSLILNVTISVGVTEIRERDARPEETLARADRALYMAKRNGRNRIEEFCDAWA